MAEAQMANLIAQSNVAQAETLACVRCSDYVLPLFPPQNWVGLRVTTRGRVILPWRIGS